MFQVGIVIRSLVKIILFIHNDVEWCIKDDDQKKTLERRSGRICRFGKKWL